MSPKRIQSLKKIIDEIFADFKTQRRYKGSGQDREALTPLHNSLESWAMGWYKPVPYRESDNTNNRSIRKYIRKEADAWLMGMMRFIEMTPRSHSNFLQLAETFPGAVWEWSLEPWSIPAEKEKRIDYIERILNRLHKFERLPTGELVDRYPPSRVREDKIGAARRRQLFLFAEGLFFMAQAAQRFQYYQTEIPFPGSESPLRRSELRGSTQEIRAALLKLEPGVFDPVKTLISNEDIPQIEFATHWTEGLYSEGSIALRMQDPDHAWLWISGRLAQKLKNAMGERGISNTRLVKALDTVQRALPAGVNIPSVTTVDWPQLHLRVNQNDANDWLVLIREHFPLVFGTLNRFHEKLVINAENTELAQKIQAAVVKAAQGHKIFLSQGQVQVLVSEKIPFVSLAKITFGDDVAIASTSAADLNKVGRRKGVNSRWLLDGNIKAEKAQFAAGIVTLLHAILDRNIDRDAIHQPSDFKVLLSSAINAVQAYAKVLASA